MLSASQKVCPRLRIRAPQCIWLIRNRRVIPVAKAALRRKKTLQADQERLAGQKFTLEAQVRTPGSILEPFIGVAHNIPDSNYLNVILIG